MHKKDCKLTWSKVSNDSLLVKLFHLLLISVLKFKISVLKFHLIN